MRPTKIDHTDDEYRDADADRRDEVRRSRERLVLRIEDTHDAKERVRLAKRMERAAAMAARLTPVFERFPLVERLWNDPTLRTVFLVYPSLGLSIVYAVFYAVVGATRISSWHVLLAGYYIMLVLMRLEVVRCDRRLRRRDAKATDERYVWKRSFDIGIMLVLMGLVLALAVVLLVNNEGGKEYRGIFIYVIAAYTVAKVTLAVRNLLKARRSPSQVLSMIRYIGQADALLAILSLQTAWLARFATDGSVTINVANGLTGAIVCLLIMALGVSMMRRAHGHLWEGRWRW